MKYGVGVGLVLVSLFVCSLAKAASGTSLEWNPNTDPSIAGYNVYYGNASRSYTNVMNVGSSTNAVVGGLVEGQTYYFAVTAYTFDGIESDFSAEFVYVVPGFLTMRPGATPGSLLQIHFPVAVGHWYELQQSVDLISWMTIWQTTGTANVWVEFDVPVSISGPRFYRLVLH
jgi:Fibronectin type III domain